MSKIGIRLLSTDCEKFTGTISELFKKKEIDYIELYVKPDSTYTINKWLKLQNIPGSNINIPVVLHAPDYIDQINLSVPDNLDKNIEIFQQIDEFKQALNARCIIISSGIKGSISEVARQLKIIKPKNVLIKNNLYRIKKMNYAVGIGSTTEEIEKLKKEFICGFCLDIGNAICSANLLTEQPYEFLRELNMLTPAMYRISGVNLTDKENNHLHLEDVRLDFSIITMTIRSNALITIDTEFDDIEKFRDDVRFLRRFCK